MGLLDWLSDAFGTNDGPTGGTPLQPGPGGQAPVLDPMGNSVGPAGPLPTGAPAPTNPMPLHDVGVGMDVPPLLHPQTTPESAFGGGPPPGVMYPAGTDPMTAGGVPPNGPGLPPKPPTDTSAASRPNGPVAGGATPGPAEIIQSYQRAGGTMMDPGRGDIGPGPEARSFIGRALGLDPNTEKTLQGSLAAGLQSAGANSNKGKGAAFMTPAGAAMEGGNKADDKIVEQQDKYLQRAIAAKREGNHAEYQKNYLRYQIEATKERLKIAKEKAASGGSVMNSPEQLYLRADALAITENGALKSKFDKTAQQFGVDSKEAKDALDAYNKGVEAARERQYGKLGLDPKKASEIKGQPGMSDKNPVKDFPKDPAAAQKAFDALPPGAYFINPKDGKLLRKKGADGAQAANPAQQPQQSALLPPMPPMSPEPAQEAA